MKATLGEVAKIEGLRINSGIIAKPRQKTEQIGDKSSGGDEPLKPMEDAMQTGTTKATSNSPPPPVGNEEVNDPSGNDPSVNEMLELQRRQTAAAERAVRLNEAVLKGVNDLLAQAGKKKVEEKKEPAKILGVEVTRTKIYVTSTLAIVGAAVGTFFLVKKVRATPAPMPVPAPIPEGVPVPVPLPGIKKAS